MLRAEGRTFTKPTLGVDEYRPWTALAAADDNGNYGAKLDISGFDAVMRTSGGTDPYDKP